MSETDLETRRKLSKHVNILWFLEAVAGNLIYVLIVLLSVGFSGNGIMQSTFEPYIHIYFSLYCCSVLFVFYRLRRFILDYSSYTRSVEINSKNESVEKMRNLAVDFSRVKRNLRFIPPFVILIYFSNNSIESLIGLAIPGLVLYCFCYKYAFLQLVSNRIKE